MCPRCREKMVFCENRCIKCGQTLSREKICINCLFNPPPWEGFAFWGIYRDRLRYIISRFKYRGDFSYLNLLKNFLYEAYTSLCFDMDIVVPIPMHSTRLRKRGFNHVLELSKVFKEKMRAEIAPEVLRRIKDTGVQVGLTREERFKNVKNAFMCDSQIEGRSVLLVDDVYTTGATALECAQVLLRAGARKVALVVIARSLEG